MLFSSQITIVFKKGKKKTKPQIKTEQNETERNKERKGLWYWDIAAFGLFTFSVLSLFINIKRGTDEDSTAVWMSC